MKLVINSSTLNREKEGTEQEWVTYQGGEAKFLIRGMAHRIVQIGIQAHREAQQQTFAQYLSTGDVSLLDGAQTVIELNSTVLGSLVLADWDGVVLESGDALDYSPEHAKAIVSDPENKPLVEWLIAEASRISREAQERVGARLGKSLPATGGNPSKAG